VGDREVGRFDCDKCGGSVVCAGTRNVAFKGIGAYTGPCPWDCGAWMNRGFRSIRPGHVKAYRADEWDARPMSALG
jgi:hypothetical protein